MTANGHRWFALATGALAVSPFKHTSVTLSVIALPFAWRGALAPDRIELLGGVQWIKHRTLTHWLAGWLAVTLLMAWGATKQPVGIPVLGYCAGALSHALADLPNPAGVPVFHPTRKVSLRWWHSGQHEFALIAVMAVAALFAWSL